MTLRFVKLAPILKRSKMGIQIGHLTEAPLKHLSLLHEGQQRKCQYSNCQITYVLNVKI